METWSGGAETSPASAATTAPVETTSASQPAASPAPKAHRRNKFKVKTKDGYVADVTVTWDTVENNLGWDDLVPECQAKLTQPLGEDFKIRRVTATITADFPQVNGVSWPTDLPLNVSVYAPDAELSNGVACIPGSKTLVNTSAVGDLHELSPATTQYVTWGRATPNKPKGAFNVDVTHAQASIGEVGMRCNGKENHISCYSAYDGKPG